VECKRVKERCVEGLGEGAVNGTDGRAARAPRGVVKRGCGAGGAGAMRT
jgi:hypothetical protein